MLIVLQAVVRRWELVIWSLPGSALIVPISLHAVAPVAEVSVSERERVFVFFLFSPFLENLLLGPARKHLTAALLAHHHSFQSISSLLRRFMFFPALD